VFSDDTREQWWTTHPAGFFEYVEAMGPSGRYGSWLRTQQAAAVVGDTLFIHGGYGPFLSGVTVDEINRRVAEEIATFDQTKQWMVDEGLALPWYSVHQMTREAARELQWIGQQDPSTVSTARLQRVPRLELEWSSWYLVHPDGPLWFRGTTEWTEDGDGVMVGALLTGLGVARQVVGHAPQRTGRVQTRVGHRVYLIDTGMLTEVYGGRPSALQIEGDRVTAVYVGERELMWQGAPEAVESPASEG
jgi:hypothetical protein